MSEEKSGRDSGEDQPTELANCKFCGLGRAAAGVLTPCMPGKSHTFTVTASPRLRAADAPNVYAKAGHSFTGDAQRFDAEKRAAEAIPSPWAPCEGCGVSLEAEPSVMRRTEGGKLHCNDCARRTASVNPPKPKPNRRTKRLDPVPRLPLTREQMRRLEALLDQTPGPEACWPWLGKTRNFWLHKTRKPTHTGATRAVYAWANGGVFPPSSHAVYRTCGNTKCANPKHLVCQTDEERLWSYVPERPEIGCWLWTGTLRETGRHDAYGAIFVGGRYIPAHRYAYELTNGPLDVGLFACHRCDNPKCVRPDHIFSGTAADNHRDMQAKGRIARGEKHRIATQASLEKAHAKLAAMRAERKSA